MPLPTTHSPALASPATVAGQRARFPGWLATRTLGLPSLISLCAAAALASAAHAAEPTEPVDVPITRGTIDMGSIRPSLGPAQRPAERPADGTTDRAANATPPTSTRNTPPPAGASAEATTANTNTSANLAGLPNPPRTVADFAAIARAKAAAEAAAASAGGPAAAAPPVAAEAQSPTPPGPPTTPQRSPGNTASAAIPAGASTGAAPTDAPAGASGASAAPTPPAPARTAASPPLRTPTPRTAPPPQDTGMQLLAEKIINAMARAEAKQKPEARPAKAKTKDATADSKAGAEGASAGKPASAPPKPDRTSRDELKAKAAALAAQVSGNEEVFLDSPNWSYEGRTGPANWHRLRPSYGLCASGQRQAPIAIDSRTTLQGPAEALDFRYGPVGASVWHTGHNIQVDVAPGNLLTVRGTQFELVELRFQHPGEGSINGKTFPMSVQLWHRSATGELLVLAIPLDVGAANPMIDTVWTYMPLDTDDRVPLPEAALDPSGLLPMDKRYFQFMGSLPTPPCSEDVLWLVMKTPVTLSAAQLTLFGQMFPLSARPPQPTNERPVREAL